MSKSTGDEVSNHRITDLASDDKAKTRRNRCALRLEVHQKGTSAGTTSPPHHMTKFGTTHQSFVSGEHGYAEALCGEALAPFVAPGGQDRTPRTGAHPKPEAVGLGATPSVRLKGTLAHWVLRVTHVCLAINGLRVRGQLTRIHTGASPLRYRTLR